MTYKCPKCNATAEVAGLCANCNVEMEAVTATAAPVAAPEVVAAPEAPVAPAAPEATV